MRLTISLCPSPLSLPQPVSLSNPLLRPPITLSLLGSVPLRPTTVTEGEQW